MQEIKDLAGIHGEMRFKNQMNLKIDEEEIKTLIDHKGKEYTKEKVAEESAELIAAHSKVRCGDVDNLENLKEEMADVYIILEMLKELYSISENDMQKWIDLKMQRNLERIKE